MAEFLMLCLAFPLLALLLLFFMQVVVTAIIVFLRNFR